MRTTTTAICKRAAVALVFTVLVLSLFTPGSSQPPQAAKDYALIFGTVWNAKNEPVYGIPIKIRRANEKKARWEQMSDHQGEFAQRVPVGAQDYIVWADIKAGKGKAKPETKVHIDNNERVDISLHLME